MTNIITDILNLQEEYPFAFYETLCLVNGKHYRGAHEEEIGEDSQKYLGSGPKLLEDIEKFGRDKFIKRNIKRFKTEKELYDYEEKWVNHKDPMSYNQCPGGKKPPTYYGEDNHMKDIKHRERMHQRMLGNEYIKGDKNPMKDPKIAAKNAAAKLGAGADYIVISPENRWYYVQKPTEWAKKHFPDKWRDVRCYISATATGRQETFYGGWRAVKVKN